MSATLFYVYMKGCPGCREQKPIVELFEREHAAGLGVTVAHVDIASKLGQTLLLGSVPSFVLRRSGKPDVVKVKSYPTARGLASVIKKALAT